MEKDISNVRLDHKRTKKINLKIQRGLRQGGLKKFIAYDNIFINFSSNQWVIKMCDNDLVLKNQRFSIVHVAGLPRRKKNELNRILERTLICEKLRLDVQLDKWNLSKFNFYKNAIFKALSCVMKELVLWQFEIDRKGLQGIISAGSHLERIYMIQCRIYSEGCSFRDDIKYEIYRLGFDYSGEQRYSNWETHRDRLEDLLKAISESSLKDSLEVLSLLQCMSKPKVITKIVKKYGLTKIHT
ncbi:unnamed protein product [Moneuplotes crassus]|uniref:Uncharacterized protein n=1 Tax=Euplotes crassus TaxID=5936 RepID=A0AAD1XR71_EUPCR|nr:unnamed protein product [Moneuplotes crassus]